MVQLTRVGLTPGIGGGAGAAPGPVVPGVNYYVSSAGNDSNDGLTTGTPWLTVGKVSGSTFNPGDTISFNGGDTFSGETLTVPSSGISGSPITFNSYGTGQATITPASDGNGILVQDKSYITIENLILTGAGSTAGKGIHLRTTAGNTTYNHTVSDCTITAFPDSGIHIQSNSASQDSITYNPTITDCTISACAFGPIDRTAGIMFQGNSNQSAAYRSCRNATVTGCTISNITGSLSAPSTWSGSGIYMGQVDTGLIEQCRAATIGSLSSGPTGIWTAGSTGVTIRRCESTGVTSMGSDGGGFDIDGGCDNCTVEYCYSHDNYGYGFLCFEFDDANFTSNHDNVIRYNVSVNDGLANPASGGNGGGGVRMQSSSLDNTGQCYNNTIILTSNNAVGIELDKATGVCTWLVANNIIYRRAGAPTYIGTGAASPGTSTVVGNNYFGAASFKVIWAGSTYTTLADWQTATGQEEIGGSSVATEVDPVFIGSGPPQYSSTYNLFMDSLILDNSSTLLDAAVDLDAEYGIAAEADWFGNTSTGWTAGVCSLKSAVSQVIYTASATTNVPADFVSIYKAECIGAGGSFPSSTSRPGSGGGAYSAGAPTLTASASLQVVIGAAVAGTDGGDTAFNASSLANAVSNGPTVSVGAQGGKASTGGGVGGAGGLASAGVGSIAKYDGGTGGANARSGGGGAASGAGAGRNGGTNGGNSTCGGGGGQGGGTTGANGAVGTGGNGGRGLDTTGGAGGATNGTNGSRGAGGGGAGTSGTGGRGGDAIEWIVSAVAYGPGGGGGGCYTGTNNRGGTYGGGAGGQSATGGGAIGGAGIARLLYHTSANV